MIVPVFTACIAFIETHLPDETRGTGKSFVLKALNVRFCRHNEKEMLANFLCAIVSYS
ncbi:MAG: hypothetical protein WCQ99_17530 [Pseudomonadota bacterium]